MTAVVQLAAAQEARPSEFRGETPLRRVWRDFASSRLALFGLSLLMLVVAAAVFAPLLAPQNPYDLSSLDLLDSRRPPGSVSSDMALTYWLGTDDTGRDILSAIFYGLRISLSVAVLSAFIALTVGTAVGLTSAYFGGLFDALVMRIVDLQLSFPSILVAMVLVAALGTGVDKVMLALVIVQWAYYARTARAAALGELGKEYIEAARCLRLGHARIVLRHLLPNSLAPLIVVLTVQMANAVALEATLSFLGLGLPITEPSLGLLIANGFAYLLTGKFWISIFPGIALLLTVVSFNLVGDQLREILNPRLQR